MAVPFIAVAGATGGLGRLLVKELQQRNAAIKVLVRPNTDSARLEVLKGEKTEIIPVDLSDVAALTQVLTGATCVVSTLQGLRDVILVAQGHLLNAAAAANVPRFIPSDFSLDFTKTKPGSNRNLDLRRSFHQSLDKSDVPWTSILNGAFMDLLGGDSPMVNHKSHKVMYVGSTEQKLDFTTMRDTAAYTAAVATDPNPTPKFLRIAGDEVTVTNIAEAQSKVAGVQYRPGWMGTVWTLETMIKTMRLFGDGDQVMPPWQGMQYMANMFAGKAKHASLDNDRYPEVKWTKVPQYLEEEQKRKAAL